MLKRQRGKGGAAGCGAAASSIHKARARRLEKENKIWATRIYSRAREVLKAVPYFVSPFFLRFECLFDLVPLVSVSDDLHFFRSGFLLL